MATRFHDFKTKNIVAYRLLLYILVFSSTITLLTISLQLYVDYKNDLVFIDEQMEQIHDSRLESISLSIWEIHYELLESQLHGILSIRDIEYVQLDMLLDEAGVITKGRKPSVKYSITRQFPLTFKAMEEVRTIGNLLVVASKKGVYTRLKDRLLLIIVSHFFKTFLVSIFILFIFYHLVTRHLSSMAHFTKMLSPKRLGTPLVLKKKVVSDPPDELDVVVSSINTMREDLFEYLKEQKRDKKSLQESEENLEKLVETRTRELQKVNAVYVATNQELKEFAYIVSHDLKAPLRAISQLTHWISKDYSENFDEEGKMQMELIIKRVKRMDGLIDGILRYSRAGQVREKQEELNLNRLVADVVEGLAPPTNVHVVVDQDLPVIHLDSIRIEQVFQNLIGNSIKYMDKINGVITIDCVTDGDFFTFSVADNGPGIDKKYHEKIFQIFQTLQPRDEHESTGVGLSLVKKIINFYGGSVWLDSAPGRGTTFFFTLPISGRIVTTH